MKIHSGVLLISTTLFSSGLVQAAGSGYAPAEEVLGLMPSGNPPTQTAPATVAAPARVQPQPNPTFPPQPPSSQQTPTPQTMYYPQQQQTYNNYYSAYPGYYNYPSTGYYYPYSQAYRSPYMANPYAMRRPMPAPKKKETKPWGDTRYIWPDFYTDFTGDFWDKMINAPYDMGYMPGGWRFPSFSSPDPVTVSDAIANQVPPFAEEAGNMVPLDDVGNMAPF